MNYRQARKIMVRSSWPIKGYGPYRKKTLNQADKLLAKRDRKSDRKFFGFLRSFLGPMGFAELIFDAKMEFMATKHRLRTNECPSK